MRRTRRRLLDGQPPTAERSRRVSSPTAVNMLPCNAFSQLPFSLVDGGSRLLAGISPAAVLLGTPRNAISKENALPVSAVAALTALKRSETVSSC